MIQLDWGFSEREEKQVWRWDRDYDVCGECAEVSVACDCDPVGESDHQSLRFRSRSDCFISYCQRSKPGLSSEIV